MFWYGHEMGWWGYAGMGIGMVLFWMLLIVGIIAFVRYLGGDRQYQPPAQVQSAEQILATRFARGEIGESEFRERLAVLHGYQTPG
ncbi:hypothetical protein AFM11_20505 [Mycolicibacterium wolinskyi]|uniref:SHOCT domain-containing protein n=1 Tax=Mycolicibacterium wolinskyi TaxID=59750 RepID=A0A132PKK2_9MYCO|nr:hypothetical protein [Mycolicibacterium wolinskyi]KWX22542.1 hypothetical protein AFM11_20505 [Mycolicibacterium wolinskyi]